MIEVACPSCRGRLIAESGALVACPHCKQLLNIPHPQEVTGAPVREESPVPFQSLIEDTGHPTDDEPSFPGLPLAETVSPDSFLLHAAAAEAASSDQPHPESVLTAPSAQDPQPATLAAAGSAGAVNDRQPAADTERLDSGADRTSDPRAAGVEMGPGQPSAPARPAAATTAAMRPHAGIRRSSGVPVLYFVLVCSYAVLATVVLLLVFFVVPSWLRPHQLESLPDIVPPRDAQGDVQIPLYPEQAQLPTGHELPLGRTQRFGAVEVQPLRVTRGPLEFVHFENGAAARDDELGQAPTAPVLKLWLRFRNVSPDQTFAPLGQALVFTRGRGKADRRRRGNNFICPADQEARPETCVQVFDHVVSGDFDLKDQHIDRGLPPGEELITYIPSEEEGLDQLQGELRWRVHFRKGLGPSGWGVTTLLDVLFHSDQIIDEGELPASPP